jgi:hypothetical protein
MATIVPLSSQHSPPQMKNQCGLNEEKSYRKIIISLY